MITTLLGESDGTLRFQCEAISAREFQVPLDPEALGYWAEKTGFWNQWQVGYSPLAQANVTVRHEANEYLIYLGSDLVPGIHTETETHAKCLGLAFLEALEGRKDVPCGGHMAKTSEGYGYIDGPAFLPAFGTDGITYLSMQTLPAFREQWSSAGNGGPVYRLSDPSVFTPTEEYRLARFWRWKDFPRRDGGENYAIPVQVWEYRPKA